MADRAGYAMQKLAPLDLTISTYAVDRSARELVGTTAAEKSVSGFLQKLQKGVFKRYVLNENNEVDVLKADMWALIQRYMVNLKTTLPTSVTPCPSSAAIKQKMKASKLTFSVFSRRGYDFTQEYHDMHVYKASYTNEQNQNVSGSNTNDKYEDLVAIVRRAIQGAADDRTDGLAVNHFVDRKYAEYIIRMAYWEASILAQAVVGESMKGLSSVLEPEMEIESMVDDRCHTKIYIGNYKDTTSSSKMSTSTTATTAAAASTTLDVLSFTVRVALIAYDKASFKTVDDDTAKDSRLDFVYYKDYELRRCMRDDLFAELPDENSDASLFPNRGTFFSPRTKAEPAKVVAAPNIPQAPPAHLKGGDKDGRQTESVRVFLVAKVAPKTGPDPVVSQSNTGDGGVAEAKEEEAEEGGRENDGLDRAMRNSKSRQQSRSNSQVNAPSKFESEASYCSEVISWGFDGGRSMGLGASAEPADWTSGSEEQQRQQELLHNPRTVPLEYSIGIQRVRNIACSSQHSLILTHSGTVYACGENADGALGLGDRMNRSTFIQIDWPNVTGAGKPAAVKVVKVAAGSSSIGSHSMAIDSEGNLYAWGNAFSTGLSSIKDSVMTPSLVELRVVTNPGSNDSDSEDEQGEGVEGEGGAERGNRSSRPLPKHLDKTRLAVDVACGGGFTVCVLQSGHVASWGMWAHGRLGLGPIPSVTTKARRGRTQNSRKIARYQLRPALVYGVENAVAAACGESHALCLLSSGAVLSWGQNSLGQLGVGPTYTGYLQDAFYPSFVAPFGGEGLLRMEGTAVEGGSISYAANSNETYRRSFQEAGERNIKGVSISCGAFHSVCVDDKGKVWSWGARGSPCLGHGDAPVKGDWAPRINTIFSIATSETTVMIPFELMEWACSWSMPRRIDSIADIKAVQVSTGDLHTAVLSDRGALYLCGSGPVVPYFLPNSVYDDDELEENEDEDEDEDEEEREEGGYGGDGEKKKKKKKKKKNGAKSKERNPAFEIEKAMKREEAMLKAQTLVTVPRSPSSSWLHQICMRKVAYVASAGCKMFAVMDEESIAPALTANLLQKLTSSAADFYNEQDEKESKERRRRDDDAVSLISDTLSEASSVFETRGKADCMIIASGKHFLCHKAILAARSPELRNMIAMEVPTDKTAWAQPLQLLLPELKSDAARALLFFIYRDGLPRWAIGNSNLLASLTRVGRTLRMPRLQLIAERFFKIATVIPIAETKVRDGIEELRSTMEMPPSTLARDMGSLVGDPEFADVRFIAEGRAIMAHRFILESRCAYFRAMFRSGMQEGTFRNSSKLLDVVVPDTFVGFLRLLIFIYTNTLPDASDGALLEDMMAADRYNIREMKLQSEHMLVPSRTNWLDLLRASELLGSAHLRVQVRGYLRDNAAILVAVFGQAAIDAAISGRGNVIEEEDGEDGGGAAGPSTTAGSSHSTLSGSLASSIAGSADRDRDRDTNASTAGRDTATTRANGSVSKLSAASSSSSPERSGLADFREEFPGLLEQILDMQAALHPAPPSEILVSHIQSNTETALKAASEGPTFPWWALALALVCGFLYTRLHTLVRLGYLIPVINVVSLIAFVYWGVRYANSS